MVAREMFLNDDPTCEILEDEEPEIAEIWRLIKGGSVLCGLLSHGKELDRVFGYDRAFVEFERVGSRARNVAPAIFGPAIVLWPSVTHLGFFEGGALMVSIPLRRPVSCDEGEKAMFAAGDISVERAGVWHDTISVFGLSGELNTAALCHGSFAVHRIPLGLWSISLTKFGFSLPYDWCSFKTSRQAIRAMIAIERLRNDWHQVEQSDLTPALRDRIKSIAVECGAIEGPLQVQKLLGEAVMQPRVKSWSTHSPPH